jgi:hypothetical protein
MRSGRAEKRAADRRPRHLSGHEWLHHLASRPAWDDAPPWQVPSGRPVPLQARSGLCCATCERPTGGFEPEQPDTPPDGRIHHAAGTGAHRGRRADAFSTLAYFIMERLPLGHERVWRNKGSRGRAGLDAQGSICRPCPNGLCARLKPAQLARFTRGHVDFATDRRHQVRRSYPSGTLPWPSYPRPWPQPPPASASCRMALTFPAPHSFYAFPGPLHRSDAGGYGRGVAQLARAPVSKTGGWGFETLHPCQPNIGAGISWRSTFLKLL